MGNNPHRIVFEEDADGVSVRSIFEQQLPNETATIIGDAVHNIRAALDHLAAAAVRASDKEPDRNTGFPIYLRQADFNGGVTSKLSGAPDAFVEYVRNQKPYLVAKDGSEGSRCLWTLGQLDNLDKHLVLLPSISILTLRDISVTTEGGGNISVGELNVGGNAHIFRVGGPNAKYKANGNPTFSVRFANTQLVDGEDVIGVLSTFEREAGRIISDAADLQIP